MLHQLLYTLQNVTINHLDSSTVWKQMKNPLDISKWKVNLAPWNQLFSGAMLTTLGYFYICKNGSKATQLTSHQLYCHPHSLPRPVYKKMFYLSASEVSRSNLAAAILYLHPHFFFNVFFYKSISQINHIWTFYNQKDLARWKIMLESCSLDKLNLLKLSAAI